WAEFILPALVILGLFTRLAALGMIGFVFVQSYVDVTGHGVQGADLGAWFDGASGSLIMDQRAFWIFLCIVLVIKGAGAVSIDHLLGKRV
ncbi:MAG: DoxX family protein, partial [Pseudomonadota bacterium]